MWWVVEICNYERKAEPVLCEGGIIVLPAPYFKKVEEALDRHNIPLMLFAKR